VVRGFQILTDPRCPYYNPLARDLIDIVVEDDYRLVVTTKQGQLDPLSLLAFDLVPAHLLTADRTPKNFAFGKNPVGTGPFMFKAIEGKEAIFVANPYYKRAHAPDGPIIKEIRLVQYGDLAEARQWLTNGTVQLLLDLTTKEMEQLGSLPLVDMQTPTQPKEPAPPYLSNGRVYWLMPNFRRRAMQNADLRKAISYGIDREKILNDVFRGKDKKYHQVVNGPYPLHSWAYNPSLTPDKQNPFKPESARTFAGNAKTALGGTIQPLSLRCPSNDPTAMAVGNQIKTMLNGIGITVNVGAMPYQQLVAEMQKDQPDFDLVYWAHDFGNESLDLWPLFDPQGLGENGRNYLGFERDSQVEGKFRELQQRRDYSYIRFQTHILHDMLTEQKMALIPLWQIDRHVAVHRSLRLTRLHPVYIVDDIEEWQLRATQ
jgi:ABC-type transport system substrate-binding protein